KPESQPPPYIRLAAQEPRAHPRIIRSGIWMVLFVHYDVFAVIWTAPVLNVRQNVLVVGVLCGRRMSDRILVGSESIVARRHRSSARVIIGPFGGLQLFFYVQLLSRFEQQYFHAVRSQNVGSHSPGRARAYYHRIVGPCEVNLCRITPE